MKRIDTDPDEVFVKAAIYGASGTGKSSFGVTAPEPLILLSERQGMPHIRAAAKRLGRDVPPVLFMDTLEDYRSVLRGLMAAAAAGDPVLRIVNAQGSMLYEGPRPKTVVVDSISDACMLVREEIYRESPPQKASDGLEKVTERHWAALRDRSEKLIRTFRNVPYHVLFLAGLDDRTTGEGDAQERTVQPAFPMRALPDFLMRSVNVVGITTREIKTDRDAEGDRVIVHGIVTTGPAHYMLKPYRPLKDREVPDFASWVQRISEAGRDEAVKELSEMVEAKVESKTKGGA